MRGWVCSAVGTLAAGQVRTLRAGKPAGQLLPPGQGPPTGQAGRPWCQGPAAWPAQPRYVDWFRAHAASTTQAAAVAAVESAARALHAWQISLGLASDESNR